MSALQEEALIGLMFDDFVTKNRMKSLDYDKVRRFARTIQTEDALCRTLDAAPVPSDEILWLPDDQWITEMCLKFRDAEQEKLTMAAAKAKDRAKEAAAKPGSAAAQMAAKKAAALAAKAALDAKEASQESHRQSVVSRRAETMGSPKPPTPRKALAKGRAAVVAAKGSGSGSKPLARELKSPSPPLRRTTLSHTTDGLVVPSSPVAVAVA